MTAAASRRAVAASVPGPAGFECVQDDSQRRDSISLAESLVEGVVYRFDKRRLVLRLIRPGGVTMGLTGCNAIGL
jgi:hypothetical protein